MQHPHTDSPQPITIDSILAAATGTEAATSNAPTRPREWLRLWKPSDFLSFDPPKDFVLLGDFHLTRGGISVLGGAPGVGKSRAALGLAIAGATGRSWMGHAVHCR